jgi:tetratricopeptide (TPR) repeat protein
MPLVRSSLARLAAALGLEPSATGIDLTTAGVLDALRRGEPYSRWLLIFDNADQPEELLPFIPSGPGDVLITSRNNRWQAVVETVQLDVFSRPESVQFLLRRVPRGLTAADANRLADKLGDLPLALVQAGAVLFEGGMPVDEYLRLLDERVTDILQRGASPEYPTPMTAAWQISVSRLRQQSPQALDLLRCCAFLGPEPIPRDVFNLGSHESNTGVGELTADPIELSTAVGVLGRFALVKIDGPYVSVHRLIQALLRDELAADEQNRYRQDAHTMLAVSAPGEPTNVRRWTRYNDLVAHVSSQATDLAHCQMPAHRALALEIVRYLYVSGDITSCRLLAEQFLPQWIKDSGADDEQVLDMKRHLGNALRELGHASEANELITTTLDSAERVLGSQNPLTLALRNAFGADLRARGEFSAARDLDAETLRLHEEAFGLTDPQTLRVMNNLAADYGFNSDYTAARDLYKKVLVRWRDPRTRVSPTEVLNSWTGLARAVRLCGNLLQARDLGKDARSYGLHELGPEHHLTLRATIDLSIAMRGIPDDHNEALELAREVLERCKRRGDQNPDTLAATVSMSNIRWVMGDLSQALELATTAAEIYPSVYGTDHPYNYGCMGNLALLRRLAGDPAEARRLNEAALAGLEERLTRDHLFTLTVAANLASDFAAMNNFGQARALGEESVTRLTRMLGEDHWFTLGCASNLALDLRAVGAYGEADALSARTQIGYQRTMNPEYVLAAAGTRLHFDFDPPPI